MRRTISGAAIAVLASATLLAGCADDSADTTDPAVDDPAVEDTMAPMEEDTMAPMDDTMAPMDESTMAPTDG